MESVGVGTNKDKDSTDSKWTINLDDLTTHLCRFTFDCSLDYGPLAVGMQDRCDTDKLVKLVLEGWNRAPCLREVEFVIADYLGHRGGRYVMSGTTSRSTVRGELLRAIRPLAQKYFGLSGSSPSSADPSILQLRSQQKALLKQRCNYKKKLEEAQDPPTQKESRTKLN